MDGRMDGLKGGQIKSKLFLCKRDFFLTTHSIRYYDNLPSIQQPSHASVIAISASFFFLQYRKADNIIYKYFSLHLTSDVFTSPKSLLSNSLVLSFA